METYWPYLNKRSLLISVSKRLFFRPLDQGLESLETVLSDLFLKRRGEVDLRACQILSVMALSYLNEVKLHNLVFQALL